MTIEVVCTCGATLKARDADAGRQVACPKCGNVMPAVDSIPAALVRLETRPPVNVFQPNPTTAKRPLWKDPVVVIGSIGPAVVLVLFFGYLYREHQRDVVRGRVATIKSQADRLATSGQTEDAYECYLSLRDDASWVDSSDSQTLANLDSAALPR